MRKIAATAFFLIGLVMHGRSGQQLSLLTPPLTPSTAVGESFFPFFIQNTNVFYLSNAKNLVPGQGSFFGYDLIFYSRSSTQNNLVVRSPNPFTQVQITAAHFDSKLFFETNDDLLPNDTNGLRDVYTHIAGQLILVSQGTNGISQPWEARNPASAAFSPIAYEATTAQFNQVDIMAFNPDTGESTLVNVETHGTRMTGGNCCTTVKQGGALIAFVNNRRVFLRNIESGVTTQPGLVVNGSDTFDPVFFQGTDYLIFKSQVGTNAENLIRFSVTETNHLIISTNLTPGQPITADRIIGYTENNQAYLFRGNQKILLSVGITGSLGAGVSHSIKSDPANTNLIYFLSDATNLVAGVADGQLHLFARNINDAITTVVQSGSVVPEVDHYDLSSNSIVVATHDRLGSSDFNRTSDVYLLNTNGAPAELVSFADEGRESTTPDALTELTQDSLSIDGRYAVFLSQASKPGGASEQLPHLLLRDIAAQNTSLIFSNPVVRVLNQALSAHGTVLAYVTAPAYETGPVPNVRPSFTTNPIVLYNHRSGQTNAFSPDGEIVLTSKLFMSADGNRIAYEVNFPSNNPAWGIISIWDRTRGSNLVAALDWRFGTPATPSKNNRMDSLKPTLSRDGRWVAYRSMAGYGLATNASGNAFQFYVSDLERKTNYLINLEIPTVVTQDIQFSANSKFVGVKYSPTPQSSRLDILNLETLNRYSPTNRCLDFYFSGTGEKVAIVTAFEGGIINFSSYNPGTNSLVLFDVLSRSNQPVSIFPPNVLPNGQIFNVVLSYDAQYIVFTSNARNLVPEKTNSLTELFIHDLATSTTMLLSNGTNSDVPNGASSRPIMAPDGRTVVFSSFASNLVTNDYDNDSDLFVVRLSAGDSDRDNLEDDWEIAYFGDLSHDGSGDTDNDGLSDAAEQRTFTNPTDDTSILRAITITSAQGRTIVWPAFPGLRYVVQYKDSISDEWQNLSGEIIATSSAGQFVDLSNAAQRFYRIKLL